MILVRILFLIACLFSAYPIYKIAKRKDINAFDIIILAHTLFFCLPPVISSQKEFGQLIFIQQTTITIFVFYLLFALTLLIIDRWYSNQYKRSISIINITYSIRITFKKVKIDNPNIFVIISILFTIFTFAYIVPNGAFLFQIHNVVNRSYEASSVLKLSMAFFSIYFPVLIFFLFKFKTMNNKYWKILLIIVILMFIAAFFMSRRTILTYIFEMMIIYYAIYKQNLSLKKVGLFSIIILLFYSVVFPFYNTIRYSESLSSNQSTIDRIYNTFNDGFQNFSSSKETAMESTESRKLGVFNAIYNYERRNSSIFYGDVMQAEISMCIPKVLLPSKSSTGAERMVERASRENSDIADSILLYSLADFKYLGCFYAVILFIISIGMYQLLFFLYRKVYKEYIYYIFIFPSLFFFLFNIEGKIPLSSFFSMIILSIICFIIVYFSKISTKNNLKKVINKKKSLSSN